MKYGGGGVLITGLRFCLIKLTGGSELARLTQEKTLQDVRQLLPSMFVGLDVNVRFHKYAGVGVFPFVALRY